MNAKGVTNAKTTRKTLAYLSKRKKALVAGT